MQKRGVLLGLWLLMSSIAFAQSNWEYAVLVVNTEQSPQLGDIQQITYIGNSGEITAPSWAEFGQKATIDVSQGAFSVLRSLGTSGFELVSYNSDRIFIPQIFGINDNPRIGKTEI